MSGPVTGHRLGQNMSGWALDGEKEGFSNSPTPKEKIYPAHTDANGHDNLLCRRKDRRKIPKKEDLEKMLQRCPFSLLSCHLSPIIIFFYKAIPPDTRTHPAL